MRLKHSERDGYKFWIQANATLFQACGFRRDGRGQGSLSVHLCFLGVRQWPYKRISFCALPRPTLFEGVTEVPNDCAI
jgi:hypothetical protein